MATENVHAPVDGRVAALAEAQHGVVSRLQLEVIGLRHGGIAWRVQAGRLHRVHRGVYAVGHRLLTLEGRWMAAVLACGPGAVLSHRDAAAALDLRASGSRNVEVTVPRRGGRAQRPGIVLHRSLTLRTRDVGFHLGIPVTAPARTLLDIADVLPPNAVERAVERAEALRIFDLTELRAVVAANASRRGSAVLAAILEQYRRDPATPRPGLEELFLDLCATHSLPRPLVNARVGPFEADFLWRDQRLVVETDGHETHGTRAAFERDRARDARLVAADYRVVRFTYRQVKGEPERVVGLLRSLLGGSA